MLVNNAGIGAQGTIEDNDDEWHRVLDVNLLGLVRVTRACLPALRESGNASIVNTCSVAATIGRLLDSADDPDAERAALEARQPHGRLVSADEIAAAIGYLSGPDAGSTTGTMLIIDGGLTSLKLRAGA